MPKLTELTAALQRLNDKKHRGRISILYQIDGSTKTCTIFINEGEIVKVKPMIDLSVLRSHNVHIKRVVLMASSNMREHELNTNMPKMADILKWFNMKPASKPTNAPASPVTAGLETPTSSKQVKDAPDSRIITLLNDVNELITPLVGKGASKQVSRIASRYSPAEQPVEFLNECRSLIEISLNRRIANELFEPLYNSVRNVA